MEKLEKMLKGSFFTIVTLLIYGILNLIRTKIIIVVFGTDINSISQIANQIFSYLVLFESGLGAAYLFKMYEPFNKKNNHKVNSLYLGLTKSLKKISIKMFIIMLIVSIIYPYFLNLKTATYVQAIIILMLLGIRFIIPYYLTLSKKNLIILIEKKYLNDIIDSTINSLIIIIEILLIKFLNFRIELVLLVGIVLTILSNEIYKYILKKNCNNIIKNDIEPSFEADVMTKDILIHQICSLVNSNIDTIILSVVNLFQVTVYTSYNTLIYYPIKLVTKIVENLRASIGLKINEDKEKTFNLFQETLSLNILCTMIILPVFITLSNKFIKLWIGEQFIMDKISLIFFSIILFHRLIINTIYMARDSKGLYKESKWYTFAQALINLVLSILLVKPFGIQGILFATVISTLLILEPFNFSMVYKKVFNKKVIIYKDMIIAYIEIIICSIVYKIVNINLGEGWIYFLVEAIIFTIIYTFIAVVVMLLTNSYFRKFLNRFKGLKKLKE